MARINGSNQDASRCRLRAAQEDLSEEVAALAALDPPALRQKWKALFGAEPSPLLGRLFMVRAIAYRLQERRFGGLKVSVERLLDRACESRQRAEPQPVRKARASAGTVLIREWGGVSHRYQLLISSINRSYGNSEGGEPMTSGVRVLIAEDDLNSHEDWRESLTSWGFQGQIAEDGVRALELIHSFNPHILVSDLRMPRKSGLELLQEIRELGIHLSTIMISGQGDIPDAVESLKLGALDYLRKPIDPAHLRQVLSNIADNIAVREENSALRRRLAEVGEFGPSFGRSLAMRRVIVAIERLAGSSASVVITGESGTGKELVARTIHEMSPRRAGPYVAVSLNPKLNLVDSTI